MANLLTPRDWVYGHPDTPEALLAVGARMAAKRGRQVRESRLAITARVEKGAWIADCPHCHAGMAIDPEWPVAQCFGEGCYTVFRQVIVPKAWRDVEAALERRPRVHKGWMPSESVADLVAENVAHAKELV